MINKLVAKSRFMDSNLYPNPPKAENQKKFNHESTKGRKHEKEKNKFCGFAANRLVEFHKIQQIHTEERAGLLSRLPARVKMFRLEDFDKLIIETDPALQNISTIGMILNLATVAGEFS